MNKAHILIAALAGQCLLATPAFAQLEPTVQIPPKTIEYFDADEHPLPTAIGATYRLETTHRDSIAGTVRKYDAAGKLQTMTS